MILVKTILNVFLAPATAFSALKSSDSTRQRTWLLLILVLMGTANLFFLKDLFIDLQYDQTITRIENSERIPEEKKAEMLEDIQDRFENPSLMSKIIMWGSNAISFPLRVIFMSLIILLTGNFIFGGNQPFGSIVNLTALTYMVSIAELALKIPLMLSMETIEVHTGLGLLNIGEQGQFLYYFLAGIDFFAIWRLILLGLGAGILYNKKPGGFTAVLFGFWIVQLIISASLGVVFSS